MEDLPNLNCKYWHYYLPPQSHLLSPRERYQAKNTAKNSGIINFLSILRHHQDQGDDSLRVAKAFVQWDAICHLHKTKLERSQQGQYYSGSDSESDDVDFRPPILTDQAIYSTRVKKVLSAVVPLFSSLCGFNLKKGGVYQCPLRRNDRAQIGVRHGMSTSLKTPLIMKHMTSFADPETLKEMMHTAIT